MEYWSHQGRHVLFAALEAACDSVAEDLAAEIQQRDLDRHASLLDEVNQLKATAAKVDQLEKDNHALIQELEQLRRKQASEDAEFPRPSSPATSSTSSKEHPLPVSQPALAAKDVNSHNGALSAGSPPCSSEDKPNWEKEYAKLTLRHAALEQRHGETRRSAERYRKSRDDWQKYAESLEGKVEKLEKKLQRKQKTDRLHPAPSTSRPQSAHTDTSNPPGQRALSSSTFPDAESIFTPGPHEDAAKGPPSRTETTPESTTTMMSPAKRPADEETEDEDEGEGDGAPGLPPLPPDLATEPVVAIKQEPSSDIPVVVSERSLRKRKHPEDHRETPTPPRRIKTEQSTSSEPVVTGEAAVFCPHESIDLDEEEQLVPTPRRQRHSEHQHSPEDTISPGAAILPTGPRFAETASQTGPPTPPRRRAHWAARSLSTEELPGTNGDRMPPIKARWALSSGIADVAEETVDSFYSPAPRQTGKRPGDRTPVQSRLHSLLNQGSPKKTPAPLRPNRPGHDHDDYQFDKENVEKMPPPQHNRQGSPVKLSSPAKGSLPNSLRGQAQGKTKAQKTTRLRDRPLAELNLEDFKVNPKVNNGYRYAFDEVVRNREERSELAGCTDPNCCGRQYRALAEAELSSGGPGILSRMADVKMMEDYLGDEFYKLVDMTSEERQEVWLKAKIQNLADRFGRHRHRFARRPTPPGFWNPDFPSTQEIEARKEEAEKAERALVEERWREAMRAGGRWLFRDE